MHLATHMLENTRLAVHLAIGARRLELSPCNTQHVLYILQYGTAATQEESPGCCQMPNHLKTLSIYYLQVNVNITVLRVLRVLRTPRVLRRDSVALCL